MSIESIPGNRYLIAGDGDAGFFGEVPASDLINGRELAGLIGLSEGTAQHTNEPWLKFAYEGKIQFVSKKTFRYGLSWYHINSANAVFGRTVTIDGKQYRVRLMKGSSKDPSGTGSDLHASEWNKLMLPIHERSIDGSWMFSKSVENNVPSWSHGLGTGRNGMYTDADLMTHNNHGIGAYSWCQETSSSNSSDRLSRGHYGVSSAYLYSAANGNQYRGWRPVLELLDYSFEDTQNQAPTISLSTSNNRTLYENDTYNISGTAQDSDAGDVVTVRYSINNGQERAIDTRISDGSSFSFNHTLTFRQGRLYRNDTAVTGELAEGSEHVLRVWAEDDNGGQSDVVQRSFYVVPNRMPELTVEPFGSRSDLIDSDKITFRGEASDPDGNDITVSYKINNSSYQQVYSGQGGEFEFQVAVGDLNVGENNITVRSRDSYGAEVQKVLRVNKSGESVPLKTAVARYKITPPNGTAKGVVLWLQRETGDLIANARIHMGANGEPENFQDMTLEATSFVEDGIEEDEWTFDNGEEAENIILEITMERSSTSSDEGIKLINGVLS